MLRGELAYDGHVLLFTGAVAMAVMEVDAVGGMEFPHLLVLHDLDHALVMQLPGTKPLVLQAAIERMSHHRAGSPLGPHPKHRLFFPKLGQICSLWQRRAFQAAGTKLNHE